MQHEGISSPKFFVTDSEYYLACVPKCCSSYYAWSILLKKYPKFSAFLSRGCENIKVLNNRDALSLVNCVYMDKIYQNNVILPYRDPMERFLSIFTYLMDISEEEITGDLIDVEIRRVIAESNSNKDVFFDFFIDNWCKIGLATPQYLFYTKKTKIISYNDTLRICNLINSTFINKTINKSIINKESICLSNKQNKKIKDLYKEDFKLRKCV
jgi:hypothetical protein